MAEEKDDPAAVLAALPRHARLLGIDLGTKTLGLALSDVERRIASPLETLERSKFTADVKKIQAIVARFGIGAIVFGLPLNMDGSEGPRAQATRAFARNLIDFDTSRRRRAALVDKMAAAYILQGFLEALGASRHSQTHS
jgi:putative holliday junction resolvase